MNKVNFIRKIAEKTGFTQKDTGATIDAALDVIENALVDGDDVKLSGFGTFETVEKAERTARNLQTGEMITVPAHKAPKFKFSKTIKDAVR